LSTIRDCIEHNGDGRLKDYSIVCLHAEITIKGFYKISKYKAFELLIQRYKHKTHKLNLMT